LAIGLALLEVTSKADDSINHRLDSFIGGTSIAEIRVAYPFGGNVEAIGVQMSNQHIV
jgi:hypothetical protein